MKRGFTMVEIILGIGLTVLIGTISIVSFNIIKKHNKEKILESMDPEIITAANLYIETNINIKNKLHEGKNAIILPLSTLVTAGLIDFGNLELTDNDYIITMLGTPEESADHCAETYVARSWKIRDGETIYICEKDVGTPPPPTNASNYDLLKDKTTPCFIENEETTRCYTGSSPNNYVKIDENTYRILKVNSDSSLLIYSSNNRSETICDDCTIPTTSIRFIDTTKNNAADYQHITCQESTLKLVEGIYSYLYDLDKASASGTNNYLDSNDLLNTINCNDTNIFSWFPVTNIQYDSISQYNTFRSASCSIRKNIGLYTIGSHGYSGTVALCGNSYNKTPLDYKIRLKSCMQIKEGVGNGSAATPYEIINNCSTT